MAIVNFSIPKTLERKIKETVKKKGFLSKAELFRFAVIRYLEDAEQLPLDKNPRIISMSQELEKEVNTKLGRKRLPPVKRQLARIKDL